MKMIWPILVLLCGSLLFSSTQKTSLEDSLSKDYDIEKLLPRQSPASLGLKELIERAKQNYELAGKEDGISKAQSEKVSAYLEFGPTISANYSYNYQTTPKINNYTGNQQAGVTANWELYSGFSTVNKVKQKEALYRASLADKEYTQENLYLQIIQQYYAYFTNYSHLLSLKQKRKLLDNNVNRLKKLYASGLTTIDDLESLKAEASLTDYQIAQAELDLEQNRLNLSLLTNSEVDKIKRDILKFPDMQAQSERADITSLREQAEGIGYQRKQLSYAPKVSLFNTFAYTDGKASPIPIGNEQKIQNTAGISVSIMLDSFSLYKQKEAIGYSQMQALKGVMYKKEEQKKDIELYKKSLDIAKIKVSSASAGLKSAMISFENVSKRYDAQLVTYVDYLNALSQKFNAEATYIESLNNYEIQKANYVFHSGQNLQDYIQ